MQRWRISITALSIYVYLRSSALKLCATKSAILLFLISATSLFQAIWSPDNRNGTYKNPIIYADYSDPDVIRVGNDFYLTASSFNSAPRVSQFFTPKDLVNWRIIGHALAISNAGQMFLPNRNTATVSGLRRSDITTTISTSSFRIPITESTWSRPAHAAGPWSAPLLIKSAKGWIDPCPFWDDDGNAYLVHAFANSRAGIKSVLHIDEDER